MSKLRVLALISLLTLAISVGCSSSDQTAIDKSISTRVAAAKPAIAVATVTAAPEPTATSVPTASPEPDVNIGSTITLNIVDDPNVGAKYDRSEWKHWTDTDGDCQDTRQEVLIIESLEDVTFENNDQCRVATGRWEGRFTAESFTSPSELDVDHLVPLANAHNSGGWSWDVQTKKNFANDLSYPEHLIAVNSSANRSKGSKSPDQWMPQNKSFHCEYTVAWISIKSTWNLSVTSSEFAVLSDLITSCEVGFDISGIAELHTIEAENYAQPTIAPTDSDPVFVDKNCSDFKSWEEANSIYQIAAPSDPHRIDSNGDGIPCESLSGAP
jgi:hypothetical protein